MKQLIASTLFLLAGSALAAEPAVQCPKSLEVVETPATVPPGFIAYLDGNPPVTASPQPIALPLQNILFSEGPPTEQATLAPTSNGKKSRRWNFSPTRGQDIWLSCAYNGTALILSTKLPRSITACEVALDADQQSPHALSCK